MSLDLLRVHREGLVEAVDRKLTKVAELVREREEDRRLVLLRAGAELLEEAVELRAIDADDVAVARRGAVADVDERGFEPGPRLQERSLPEDDGVPRVGRIKGL